MSEAALYCANHPTRETMLRCNRCGKPICASCAMRTPVGYRCRECVRGQQAAFDTGGAGTLIVSGLVSAIGTGIAIPLISFLGFWGLLLAPVAGGGLAEVVRWAVRRKRNRRLPLSAAVGAGIGVAAYLLLQLGSWLLIRLAGGEIASGLTLSLLWPLGYGLLLIGALYSRLRGIRLGG